MTERGGTPKITDEMTFQFRGRVVTVWFHHPIDDDTVVGWDIIVGKHIVSKMLHDELRDQLGWTSEDLDLLNDRIHEYLRERG